MFEDGFIPHLQQDFRQILGQTVQPAAHTRRDDDGFCRHSRISNCELRISNLRIPIKIDVPSQKALLNLFNFDVNFMLKLRPSFVNTRRCPLLPLRYNWRGFGWPAFQNRDRGQWPPQGWSARTGRGILTAVSRRSKY